MSVCVDDLVDLIQIAGTTLDCNFEFTVSLLRRTRSRLLKNSHTAFAIVS